jgi:CHAT domain-containing protein/Tfp pilus assembly protein PilF
MWFERSRRLLAALAFTIALSLTSTAAWAGPREETAALYTQARQYWAKGDYAKAAEFLERAAKLGEKTFGPDHLNLAAILNNLAEVYIELGRYAEAEQLDKRVLAIHERANGPDDPGNATGLYSLASVYMRQGRYAEAEPLYKRGVAINEKARGPNHPEVAKGLEELAAVYRSQGRYAEAEALFKRCMMIDEKALGPENPELASTLSHLAYLYLEQGRNTEAEPLLKRALALTEKAHSPNHPDVASALDNLSQIYLRQGRYAEAESLKQRALAIAEKAFGPDHPAVATSLNNLGVMYFHQGRYAEAEPFLKRAVAISEKTLGPDHPDVATHLHNLASLYLDQGRFNDAEPIQKRALAIREKALGADHPDVASSLHGLAYLYSKQGKAADAEQLYKRALTIREKALGPDHPDVAANLFSLADFYDDQGRVAEALEASRAAVALLIRRSTVTTENRSTGFVGERQTKRGYFLQLVHILALVSSKSDKPAPEVVDEAFRAAQYAYGVETAKALAGMTARYAANSDALGALVRERQDLANRWQKLDTDLLKAVSQPPDKRNPAAEATLRQDLAELDAKLKTLDGKLRADFPRFAELAAARPVGVADVQNVLEPGEVFAAIALGKKESYLFVIDKDRAQFFKLDITRAQAAEAVQAMRKTLLSESPFDLGKAHDLYKALLGPADGLIAGAKRLILVPDGALQSLPPTVLITSPPSDTKKSDYKTAAWLIRRQALTVLPAASSLVSLRNFAETRQAKDAFVGFGDPDFKGDRDTGGMIAAGLYRGAEANLDGLRRLPRLEETAGELRAEAKALGAPESSVHLGPEVTVTLVKRLDLADARVIAFATHGLIAGDLPQLTEPALVLTPPANPTPEDDGLLRASQVAQLKLNADFVILSACNTAAPDGKPGAEGLSGLAKAFFYAGARSILVSHWPVDSDATVKLTTGLIRAAAADPSIGRAEALRRSILAMIDAAPAGSNQAHPALWAPFILAGEGGMKR